MYASHLSVPLFYIISFTVSCNIKFSWIISTLFFVFSFAQKCTVHDESSSLMRKVAKEITEGFNQYNTGQHIETDSSYQENVACPEQSENNKKKSPTLCSVPWKKSSASKSGLSLSSPKARSHHRGKSTTCFREGFTRRQLTEFLRPRSPSTKRMIPNCHHYSKTG